MTPKKLAFIACLVWIHSGLFAQSPTPPKLWGMTYTSVFDVGTDGTNPTTVFRFKNEGINPGLPLVKASDGFIYGVASGGGANSAGVFYRMASDGSGYTKLFDFPMYMALYSAQMVEVNGALYGWSYYGGIQGGPADANGTIFTINRDGTGYTILHQFGGPGSNFVTSMVAGQDGKLYGTAFPDSFFRMNPDGTGFTVLKYFNPIDGVSFGGLLLAHTGEFYGVASQGGSFSAGVIFKIHSDGSNYQKVHEFTGSAGGSYPLTIYLSQSGTLFGMTQSGGANYGGILFSVKPDGSKYKGLFDLSYTDGTGMRGSFVENAAGEMFGVFNNGGLAYNGVVFKIGSDGSGFTPVVSFDGTNGSYPAGPLVEGAGGRFFGTALNGGPAGSGIIYSIASDGSGFNIEHNFLMDPNGETPYGTLTLASNGDLYGATGSGGTHSFGTLFKFKPDGTFTKLHDFSGPDGMYPYAGSLVEGADGYLYGVTPNGGPLNAGVLFKIKLDGSDFTKIYDFDYDTSGAYPYSTPTFVGGVLYGTTWVGGLNGNGTLYRINSDGSGYASVHDFDGTNGANSYGGVMLGADGMLYGTTVNGGVGAGTVFKINPDGSGYTVLSMMEGTSILYPYSQLVQDASGVLYGTYNAGGSYNLGGIFSIKTDGTGLTSLHDFNGVAGGSTYAGLTKDYSGTLYGMTQTGGLNNLGAVFKMNPDGSDYTVLFDRTEYANGGVTFVGTPKASQTITFNALSAKTTADLPFTLTATASSTLAVSYTSSNPLVATVLGNMVTIIGAGTTTITASQPGNESFNAAPDVQQTLTVNPANLPNVYVTNPADGATGIKPTVTITAKKVNLAMEYTIQISPLPDFSLGVLEAAGARTQKFTELLYNTVYYCRVMTELDPSFGKTTTFKTHGAELYAYVTSPADMALNQKTTLNVTSHLVANAAAYSIELNTASDFSGTSILQYGGRTISFSGLSYGTTYYSRVRTEFTETWGATRSFSTLHAEDISYVTSPKDGAVGQKLNLNVTANLVPGASEYTIELNTSQYFNGTSILMTGARTQAFSGLAYSTTYYSRVKTEFSSWGATRSFSTLHAADISYVTNPADNSTNVLWQLNISSSNVPGAGLYTIQISPYSDFSSGVIETSGPTRTLAFTGLSFDTQYYARVRTDLSGTTGPSCQDQCAVANANCMAGAAGDADIQAICSQELATCMAACGSSTPNYEWGPLRSFTTGNPINSTYLVTPTDGATNTSWVLNLVANNVVGANLYTIEANTQSNWGGTSITKSGLKSINFTLLQDKTYYVRVKTDLAPTSWGATRIFSTGNVVSLAYVTSPIDGGTGVPADVKITSNAVPGANKYTIEINTSPGFDGVGMSKVSSSRSIQFNGLDLSTTYSVRVKTNLSTAWGPTQSFTTADPAARYIVNWQGDDEGELGDENITLVDGLDIRVHPNPFVERIHVQVQTSEQMPLQATLSDMDGKTVFQSRDWETNRSHTINQELSTGAYLLILQAGTEKKVVRVVKAK